MAVVATQVSPIEGARSRSLSLLLSSILRHAPIVAVLALTVGIHIPTLGYHFFGDDFLVLGDIKTRSFGAYARDTFLLRDLTPNWRPLSMLAYWAEFKLFGLDAQPWRIVNLAVHGMSVLMLYALVLSMTKRIFVAAAAALIFGVSASAVHTVTYITAFPHVLSELLLITSLFALHRYVERDERDAGWYWLSLLLYIAGFTANEGGVVLGIVLAAYFALMSFWRRRNMLEYVLKMAPFAIAAAALIGSLSGCGCQGVDNGFYGVGWHIPRETWIYMSRLAYPVDAIALEPSALEWAIGSVVAAVAIFFLIRGPNIARIAAIGMVAALMPYVPGKIWTASRYTYMAVPFFAVIVAIAAGFVHHHVARFSRPVAHVLAALALGAVGGLYGWQTLHQTQPFLDETERWELLTTELRANYQTLPEGTSIYIIDDNGEWSNAYWQPTWMRSVGLALYGRGTRLTALPEGFVARIAPNLDERSRILEFRDGHLQPSNLPIGGAAASP